jgi:hypothetical protein
MQLYSSVRKRRYVYPGKNLIEGRPGLSAFRGRSHGAARHGRGPGHTALASSKQLVKVGPVLQRLEILVLH